MNIWGNCEKHKVQLSIRYCENGKSYTYCSMCEKESFERLKNMFNTQDSTERKAEK